MEKIKSTGKCVFCNKEFSKAGIGKHLSAHLSENTMHKKAGKSYHVKIELSPRWGGGLHFLHLLIDGEMTFGDLDEFLREIWLECCGHMSAFRNPGLGRGGGWDLMDAYDLLNKGKTAEYEKIMEDAMGEIPKSRKTKDVFVKDLKLDYEYDFGSSTELQLTVIAEYPFVANGIEILSRNEPLKLMCDKCHTKTAISICTVCWGYKDEGIFCAECAKKHRKECSDFADYAKMRVVNSPRMGVCAYEGGTIDKKRDGIYKIMEE